MAAKLGLVLKHPISPLAFRAAIFALLLYWLRAGTLPAAVFFILGASWLYFRPLFNSSTFIIALAVLLALAGLIVPQLSGAGLGLVSHAAIIYLAFLFFILLGLKNLVLVRRDRWYLLVSFSLFYLLLLNFFLIDRSSWFIGKWLFFGLLALGLFWELLKITAGQSGRKITAAALILTLIISQLLLIISWLPLNFAGSANLAMLAVFLLADLALNRSPSKKLVARDLLIYLALSAAVLLGAGWG